MAGCVSFSVLVDVGGVGGTGPGRPASRRHAPGSRWPSRPSSPTASRSRRRRRRTASGPAPGGRATTSRSRARPRSGRSVDASQADGDLRPIWVTDRVLVRARPVRDRGQGAVQLGLLVPQGQPRRIPGRRRPGGRRERGPGPVVPVAGLPAARRARARRPDARRGPGEPFQVQRLLLRRRRDAQRPPQGALVSGAFEPTDANGTTTITRRRRGRSRSRRLTGPTSRRTSST